MTRTVGGSWRCWEKCASTSPLRKPVETPIKRESAAKSNQLRWCAKEPPEGCHVTLERHGNTPPEEFAAIIRMDVAKWRQTIVAAGIKIE